MLWVILYYKPIQLGKNKLLTEKIWRIFETSYKFLKQGKN